MAQNTDTETRYHHAVALEILDREGRTLWKGDGAWWSHNLDILDDALLPLQLLVADLPNNGTVKPEVPRVRSSRIKTFYVIITLEKNSQGGYDVDRAKIASESEYRTFLDRLARWRTALSEYYAVFD